MDKMLLRVFQSQVAIQLQAILMADRDLTAALGRRDVPEAWYSIQNLLTAAANASKALWGSKGKREAERADLRASIDVRDDSPLRDPDMRNNFEHIDERLDTWWAESPRHNYSDLNIGIGFTGVDEIDNFRNYEPGSGELVFWGDRFNLRAIVDEARRLLPLALAEANKPHWGPMTPEEIRAWQERAQNPSPCIRASKDSGKRPVTMLKSSDSISPTWAFAFECIIQLIS